MGRSGRASEPARTVVGMSFQRRTPLLAPISRRAVDAIQAKELGGREGENNRERERETDRQRERERERERAEEREEQSNPF